jgi:hypothetical protein
MIIKKLTAGISCLALLLHISVAYAEEDEPIRLNLELSHASNDNLNRSADDAAAVDSTFTTGGIDLSTMSKLGQYTLVNYRASLRTNTFQDASGMDHSEAGFSIQLRHKTAPGFTKPVISLSASITSKDFKSDLRDSTTYQSGLVMSSWITDKMSMRGGIRSRLTESDSRVHDLKDHKFFINADLLITKRFTTYATFSFIKGQSLSTIPISNTSAEVLAVIAISDEFELDPTFASNQISYRFDADTRTAAFGINYAIAKKQSLDFSVLNVFTQAQDNKNVDYKSTILNLSYLVSF